MNNRGQRELAFRPAAETCHTPLIPWGGTHTAADPDAAVIQRPPRPEPKLQGQSGRPGCAETDRAQRAPTRPLCPKTEAAGAGSRRSRGGGPRTRKTNALLRAWFQVQKTSRWGRGIKIVAGHRVACQGFRREANASEQHGSALSARLLIRYVIMLVYTRRSRSATVISGLAPPSSSPHSGGHADRRPLVAFCPGPAGQKGCPPTACLAR